MPWKDTQKMDQRIEFAMKAIKCSNFRGLCREYGISAKTGYKWRERFVAEGIAGMEERSRRPDSHAHELSEAVVCEIVRLKQAHPHWGPKKIRALYERQHRKDGRKKSTEQKTTPSESSFKRVLEKAGLTVPRKKRRARNGGRLTTGRKAEAPNDVWTVDFKGWWKDSAGLRVEPLTIRDEYSRMLLEMRALENSRTESVRKCFERLFEQHGLPIAIRSDNGPPFACSHALLGLSRLSAWWLALGIELERSRPGCPQDNGAHERMHLDIRRELQAGRVGRDAHAFELWRQEYNTERPHETLNMDCPAEHYKPSPRSYEGTPDQLDYGAMETRKVTKIGTIRYDGELIPISTTLQGWEIGLAPQKEGPFIEMWFASLLLGHYDPKTARFNPSTEGAGSSSSTGSTKVDSP